MTNNNQFAYYFSYAYFYHPYYLVEGPMPKRHTRKQHKHQKQHKQRNTAEDVFTVPELRRAFEHIDGFAMNLLHSSSSMEQKIAEFCEEWKRTFYREIKHESAKTYLETMKEEMPKKKQHGKTRRLRGGAMPLVGAPLDYQTRPGVYIQPAVNSYAQVPAYVDKGFWNPEQAQSYDPVPGQPRYVTQPPPGMGSGRIMGGGRQRKSARKLRGGAAPLGQAFMDTVSQIASRIAPAVNPPSVINDATSIFRGQVVGQSPDPTQTRMNYMMSPTATAVPNMAVSPINVNLMRDIAKN